MVLDSVILVLNESKYSMPWVLCAFGNAFSSAVHVVLQPEIPNDKPHVLLSFHRHFLFSSFHVMIITVNDDG